MNQRAIVILTAAVGVLTAFLPWLSAPFLGSVAGTDGTDGWIVVGVFGVAALLAFAGTPQLTPGRRTVLVLLGLAGAAIAIWKITYIYDLKAQAGADATGFSRGLSNAIRIGAGLWLMLVAGAALVLEALLMKDAPAGVRATLAVPACRACGGPSNWVPEYQRYFCARCNQYV